MYADFYKIILVNLKIFAHKHPKNKIRRAHPKIKQVFSSLKICLNRKKLKELTGVEP